MLSKITTRHIVQSSQVWFGEKWEGDPDFFKRMYFNYPRDQTPKIQIFDIFLQYKVGGIHDRSLVFTLYVAYQGNSIRINYGAENV